MPILKLKPQWQLGTTPRVVNQQIGEYEKGNLDTVAIMQRIARERSGHPKVRQLALNILQEAGVEGHNFLDEAVALGTFVQNNIRYVRDPNGIEQLHDPLFLIQRLEQGSAQGDCDDQALLLSSMLLAIGAQPYYVIVRYKEPNGAYNHIYTAVYDRNWRGKEQRLALDTIIKDKPMGFEVPYINKREIPV